MIDNFLAKLTSTSFIWDSNSSAVAAKLILTSQNPLPAYD